jgi:hypothetical protein
MTVQVTLPKDLELRLIAEVDAGRHTSLEAAILEKISRYDGPDLFVVAGMDAAAIRRDLDNAWNDRSGATDGQSLIDRLAARSESFRAEGR